MRQKANLPWNSPQNPLEYTTVPPKALVGKFGTNPLSFNLYPLIWKYIFYFVKERVYFGIWYIIVNIFSWLENTFYKPIYSFSLLSSYRAHICQKLFILAQHIEIPYLWRHLIFETFNKEFKFWTNKNMPFIINMGVIFSFLPLLFCFLHTWKHLYPDIWILEMSSDVWFVSTNPKIIHSFIISLKMGDSSLLYWNPFMLLKIPWMLKHCIDISLKPLIVIILLSPF